MSEQEFEVERGFILRQHNAVRMLAASIPARFRDVKVATFAISKEPGEAERQRVVIDKLCEVCRDIQSFCERRAQLFIWGRVGTGKDHLAISAGKQAAMAGYSCRWVDAATLYESMGSWEARKKALRQAVEPDILILSDAVCNRSWSEAKQAALRRIANERWVASKATWITANVTNVHGPDPNSAETLMVRDTLSRLLHNATVLHCDWKDWRVKL
jgi:DNA replication protein DnaC